MYFENSLPMVTKPLLELHWNHRLDEKIEGQKKIILDTNKDKNVDKTFESRL